MNLCQCGNHKKKTAKMCRECYTLYLQLSEKVAKPCPVCGGSKSKTAKVCKDCYLDSLKAGTLMRYEERIRVKSTKTRKRRYVACQCGRPKTMEAETCRICYIKSRRAA